MKRGAKNIESREAIDNWKRDLILIKQLLMTKCEKMEYRDKDYYIYNDKK